MWPPPRSSRRWPSSCLDKIPVRLPEVELVHLDFLWQHAEALFIEFQLHGEVGRFVVGVPTEMVDVGVTVHDAGAPRGHCRPRRCGPSSACCRLPPTAARSAG